MNRTTPGKGTTRLTKAGEPWASRREEEGQARTRISASRAKAQEIKPDDGVRRSSPKSGSVRFNLNLNLPESQPPVSPRPSEVTPTRKGPPPLMYSDTPRKQSLSRYFNEAKEPFNEIQQMTLEEVGEHLSTLQNEVAALTDLYANWRHGYNNFPACKSTSKMAVEAHQTWKREIEARGWSLHDTLEMAKALLRFAEGQLEKKSIVN